MNFCSAILILLTLTAGCGMNSSRSSTRVEDEATIYSMLFRQSLISADTNAIYVLSVGIDTNQFALIAPPEGVLANLGDLHLALQTWPDVVHALTNRPGGETIMTRLSQICGGNPTALIPGMVEPRTHRPYIYHAVHVLRWISNVEVEVAVSSVAGPLAGYGFKVRLRKGKAGWTSGERYDDWIS